MKISAITNTQNNLKPNFKGRFNAIELNADRVAQFKKIGENPKKLRELIEIMESTYQEAKEYIERKGLGLWVKDLEHMGKFVENCKQKPSRAATFFVNKFSNKNTPFYQTYGVHKNSSQFEKDLDLIFTVEAEMERNFNHLPIR